VSKENRLCVFIIIKRKGIAFDRQHSTSQRRAVEPDNRRVRLGGVGHVDKSQAGQATGFPILGQMDALHGPVDFEQLA
jgi:hypothetical protein